MAQCCYDEDAIFADDFEDGAPLGAYYESIFGGLAKTGGAGINGSTGLTSTSQYDEMTRRFDSSTDFCGNPRSSFAVGGYWKVDSLGNDFYILELREGALNVLLSFYQVGADLAVYTYDPTIVEIYRVSNVFSTSVFRKVEFRGRIPTFYLSGEAQSRTSNNDGYVEARIDGRVYPNGSNFAEIDPHSPEDQCTGGVSFSGSTTELGWDRVIVSAHGAMDCLYIKENDTYCNESELGRPPGRCPEPGPGGSSFDGTASGQRAVQLGGYPATYVPPTGGGRLPTAADPAEPQTASSITRPIVTLDITFQDATVRRYSFSHVARSGAAPAVGRLVGVSELHYPLSDRFGSMSGQIWDAQIEDADGTLRAMLASGTNRYFKKWEGILYVEDDTARLAGTARRKLARGRAISVQIEQDQAVTISFSDELSRHDSPFSLDRELPHVLISDVFKPTMACTGVTMVAPPTDDVLQLPTPMLLGECSDERRINENPPVTPIGICPLRDVGDYTLADGKTYIGFLVCLYAVKGIPALFASNLDPLCPSNVRMDPDVFSNGEFLVPGKGSGALSWSGFFATNYLDITTGGTTYRVTMVFGRGKRAEAHREGKVPVSANVDGYESTGDTTGTMLDDIPYLVEFLLEHPILRQTTTGSWGAYAAFADGTSKVRHSSFTAAKGFLDERLASGYKGALLMYERRAARDWLAELLVCGDLRLGINHHGQVIASVLDYYATLTGLTTYRDSLHIKDGSFQITSELNSELENAMSWDAGPEPSSGRTSVAKETTTATLSVTNWGETYKADERTLQAIYQVTIARDLVGRRLLATLDGITRGQFTIDLRGGDLEQGQLIRSTDFRGLGATGWTDRLLRVTERVALVDLEDLSYVIHWEDVHDQLVAPGTTTTSAIGFNPVGDAISGGWIIGDATSGGWRIG